MEEAGRTLSDNMPYNGGRLTLAVIVVFWHPDFFTGAVAGQLRE